MPALQLGESGLFTLPEGLKALITDLGFRTAIIYTRHFNKPEATLLA